MKIVDLLCESINENYLEIIKKAYYEDKGTYNNATHKFNFIRKKLSSDNPDLMKVTAGEFFEYLKSKKKDVDPMDAPRRVYKRLYNEEMPKVIEDILKEHPSGKSSLDFTYKIFDRFRSLPDTMTSTEKFRVAKEDAMRHYQRDFPYLFYYSASSFFASMGKFYGKLAEIKKREDAFGTGDWDDKSDDTYRRMRYLKQVGKK